MSSVATVVEDAAVCRVEAIVPVSRVDTVVEDAVECRVEAIVPVSRVATVVEDAVECRIEAIVGAGKHPEQLLPTEVHLAGRVRVNTKPEIIAKIQAVVSDYRAQGGSLIRLYIFTKNVAQG